MTFIPDGAVINGRFRIVSRLGSGTQGSVFKVVDRLRGDAAVALKLCSRNATLVPVESEFVRLFDMGHPHLAAVFDFQSVNRVDGAGEGADDLRGLAFFTEECVDGNRADEWVKGLAGKARAAAAGRIAVAVARALRMLHSRGILHLDVKPANIIVSPDGSTVKLIDLGLAQLRDRAVGLRLGTPGYMAPEAFEGFPDERSDVFSLGRVLLELLSGRRPDPAPGAVVLPDPDCSPALRDLVAAMTARLPGDRVANAAEALLRMGRAFGPSVLGRDRSADLLDAASDVDDVPTRTALTRSTAFIGRVGELAHLTGFMDGTGQSDGPRLCVVAGPPGIGKSRLIHKAVAGRQLELVRGGASSLACVSGDLPSVVRTLLPGPDAEGRKPLEQWLRGRDGAGSLWMSRRVMNRLRDVIAGLSGPAVVHLENVPRAFTALLAQCLSDADPLPPGVGIIAETDGVDDGLATAGSPPDVVVLGSLSPDEEEEMFHRVSPVSLSSGFIARCRRRTGGNPRVIETLMEQLPQGETSTAPDDAAIDRLIQMPSHFSIVRRIMDGASGSGRRVLLALYGAAGPLTMDGLGQVTGMDRAGELERLCTALRNSGWLCLDGDRVSLTGFVESGMTSCVSDDELRPFSAAALPILRAVAPAERLAVVAFRAGDRAAATTHATRAVEGCLGRGDAAGAIPPLRLLVDLASADERPRFQLELARALRRCGEYEPALAALVAAATDPGLQNAVQLERGAVRLLNSRTDEAIRELMPLLSAGDVETALEARALCARALFDRGDPEGAARLLEDLPAADETALQRTGVCQVMGLLHLHGGRIDAAREVFSRGLAAAQDNPARQARCHAYLGMVAHARGDWSEAAAQYDRAYLLSDECGDRHGAATAAVNLAAALTELEQVAAALRRYRDGMVRLSSVGRPAEVAQAGANYARLLHRIGDAEGARQAADRALQRAREGDAPTVLTAAMAVCGEVNAAAGFAQEGAAFLEEALGRMEGEGVSDAAERCRVMLADARLQQGRTQEARVLLAGVKARGGKVAMGLDCLAAQVLAAADGETELPAAVEVLTGALPQTDLLLSGEHYFPLCAAAFGYERQKRMKEAAACAERALGLLARMRRATPALHRPGDYRHENRLSQLRGLANRGASAMRTDSADPDVRALWLERIIRITARLNSVLELDGQLELIMDAAIDVTGAERGFLLLSDADGALAVRCARNIDAERLNGGEPHYSRTVAERSVAVGEIIVTTDAREDARYSEAGSIAALHLRYIVAVPLAVKGRTIGTIYLDSRSGGHFDETRLSLLRVLADQAAIAIHNSSLMADVRRQAGTIAELNGRLEAELQTTRKALGRACSELRDINGELAIRHSYFGLIGQSKAMKDLFGLLERIVATDMPVVILGESGTGKELVARALHVGGPRKKGAFVAENCAAIPAPLLESILFGHVRGAFTGAVASRNGLFAEADGGTLFLDEIGELPLDMQTRLLRVLQEGEVRPVGGNRAVKVDVRVLAASNRNLREMVKRGTFREDLFYRLHVMEVALPALRERQEDIPVLVRHFIAKHQPKRKITVTGDAMALMMSFSWPGNVRQLENEVMRATVLCEDVLDVEHLSEGLKDPVGSSIEELADLRLEPHVDRLKKRLIRLALRRSGNNRSRAAELLGVSRFGLSKMIERLEQE